MCLFPKLDPQQQPQGRIPNQQYIQQQLHQSNAASMAAQSRDPRLAGGKRGGGQAGGYSSYTAAAQQPTPNFDSVPFPVYANYSNSTFQASDQHHQQQQDRSRNLITPPRKQ